MNEITERLHQKLVKNRESARNSRKRKKIYVELLEKKVQELTQELFAARKQLEAANINSNQTAVQSKLVFHFFLRTSCSKISLRFLNCKMEGSNSLKNWKSYCTAMLMRLKSIYL